MNWLNIRKTLSVVILLSILFVFPATAQQELKYPYPRDDRKGIPGPTFTMEMGLWRLAQITEGLSAYDRLFTNCRRFLDKTSFTEVMQGARVASDMRTVGFANLPKIVEVTLRRQNLVIAMLEYDLASERFELNKLNRSERDSARVQFSAAKKQFQDYYDSIHWAD